ncbi:hypothetical protein SBOR_2711 [Sclerotinia borealis F-4128]|uniref:Uncharacterized protein n=1 Tax=Sclerotinia borealis (strain F-4128) TaxID=1432307 RepID=W9CJH5_SCLBF|nr:hypothetical protein SBOR_2711 [Sclerotinia borealis F-4128]
MSQEVYKKVGRGGAGNFYSKQDVEKSEGVEQDIEAQSSSSASIATKNNNKTPSLISQALRAVASAGHPPEYQHTGRGGAGNLTSPASLLSSGLTQTTTSYSNPTINPAPPSSSPRTVRSSMQSIVYKGGRGGAGNYDWEGEEGLKVTEEKKEIDDNVNVHEANAKKESEIEKMVVEDVDGEGVGGVRKPGKAYDVYAGKEREGRGKGVMGGVGE